MLLDSGLAIGAALAYDSSNLSTDAGASSDGNTFSGGLSVKRFADNWELGAAIYAGNGDFDNSRVVGTEVASSQQGQWMTGTELRAGLHLRSRSMVLQAAPGFGADLFRGQFLHRDRAERGSCRRHLERDLCLSETCDRGRRRVCDEGRNRHSPERCSLNDAVSWRSQFWRYGASGQCSQTRLHRSIGSRTLTALSSTYPLASPFCRPMVFLSKFLHLVIPRVINRGMAGRRASSFRFETEATTAA